MHRVAIDEGVLSNLKGADLIRALKELEALDDAERGRENTFDALCYEETDQVEVFENGTRMLHYDSFLKHQRYYDDWKHADMGLINFGDMSSCRMSDFIPVGPEISEGQQLVIEQDKALGKGGFVWDAAFVLAEHLILTQRAWLNNQSPKLGNNKTKVLELGSGTGMTGLAVAKFLSCDVTITDLPQLLHLMERNITRNFGHQLNGLGFDERLVIDEHELNGRRSPCSIAFDAESCCEGTAQAKVLRWGDEEDYPEDAPDVIIGADIVASIYDETGLLRTIYDISTSKTKIILSYRGRLDSMMPKLIAQVEGRFSNIKCIQPFSRNRNPSVRIIEISGKIE